MELSFRSAAVKGLRKKKVWSKAMVKSDSKSCGFENLTEDLFIEILLKLSAKQVTRAMCVSQLWYSVISSRYFTNLFLESSSLSKRPRLLMFLVDKEYQRNYEFLSSSSHIDHVDTPVSVFDQTLDIKGLGGYFVNALRGLLCVRLGRSVRICNLTTMQLVDLPIRSRLLAEANDNVWSYFGHDPVHDEYKVLSTVWEDSEGEGIVRSEHQMLVLGPGAYWRNTYSISPLAHRPYSQGISINGVLYYGAWIYKNICVVMSFDFAYEEFNVIELPAEAGIVWHKDRANLINYGGKLAVLEYSSLSSNASVDLWVLEDAGDMKWSNKNLVLPLSQMNFVHGDKLEIQCMSRCGEIRLGFAYDFLGG
ncbi:F-box associated interaction domain [Arabidopsis suecica]|uniref:F-box associated interaction domain n=1 Tax=Arabidopsis suecica TaxID=45249 RepID=A0A8T2A0U8_ARASU|nr:F-box associated interaction domain [Arabidopsis suecica]